MGKYAFTGYTALDPRFAGGLALVMAAMFKKHLLGLNSSGAFRVRRITLSPSCNNRQSRSRQRTTTHHPLVSKTSPAFVCSDGLQLIIMVNTNTLSGMDGAQPRWSLAVVAPQQVAVHHFTSASLGLQMTNGLLTSTQDSPCATRMSPKSSGCLGPLPLYA